MDAVDTFFSDLREQVEEDLIVDDEETLARVALLVPVLMQGLRRTLAYTSEGLPFLNEAEQTIRAVTES